jgi:putative ABC transport system permease protein
MRIRDFRIGWRALVQEPAYSLVVVLGLGIGFAAFLLLIGFVRYSWEYNSHVPQVENVYVVKQRDNVNPLEPWFDQSPLLLRAAALKLPGVEVATAYIPARPQVSGMTVRAGSTLFQLNGLTVLPGFVETLGVTATHGDIGRALANPEGIALSEAAARRLFGSSDIVGRSLHMEGKLLRVDAVLATPPANSTVPFEALVGSNSVTGEEVLRKEMLTGEMGWWGKVLLRLKPGVAPEDVAAALQRVIDQSPVVQKQSPETLERIGKRKVMDVVLSPLRDAYFDRQVAENHISAPGDRGHPAVVAGLGVIALLILLLASANYVNLAAVRTLRRQREMAVRKVLGAAPRRIALQLLVESMLVAMFATALGLLLAWAALPVFSELVNRRLEGIVTLQNAALAVLVGALLGAATSAYPVWIALRVRPASVLAGKPDAEPVHGTFLRRTLTVMQLATAIGLASVTLAIAWQTQFAMQASAGFDGSKLLIVDLPESYRGSAAARNFAAALKAQQEVAGVAVSGDAVGRNRSSWMQDMKRPGGPSVSVDVRSVSANFFEEYGIKPTAGRLFQARRDKDDDAEPVVINAIAARQLGFADPAAAVGEILPFTDFSGKVIPKRVLGIAPDIRYQSLREAPRAVLYELWTFGQTLTVRGNAPLAQTEALVAATWPKYFPDALLRMSRANAILAENYADEARIARLLALASAIAFAIAAFGTYALAAHAVQRRAREIVLRKLHGAGAAAIAGLLAREMGKLLAMASVVGLPVAALTIQRYLAPYLERSPLAYWSLLLALAATCIVAVLALARHARAAVRMRPADALRA